MDKILCEEIGFQIKVGKIETNFKGFQMIILIFKFFFPKFNNFVNSSMAKK